FCLAMINSLNCLRRRTRTYFVLGATNLILFLPPRIAHPAELSSHFNLPVQHRTRTCVEMKGERVPLRLADGAPTGFYGRADDPSKQGESKPCPAGSLELDAQEAIQTADGMVLYFHPGGGHDHYKDPIENGQYGHIAREDLRSEPALPLDEANGRPAPL